MLGVPSRPTSPGAGDRTIGGKMRSRAHARALIELRKSLERTLRILERSGADGRQAAHFAFRRRRRRGGLRPLGRLRRRRLGRWRSRRNRLERCPRRLRRRLRRGGRGCGRGFNRRFGRSCGWRLRAVGLQPAAKRVPAALLIVVVRAARATVRIVPARRPVEMPPVREVFQAHRNPFVAAAVTAGQPHGCRCQQDRPQRVLHGELSGSMVVE